ncbi:Metalloprotease [Phytophthora megakarya]|uniref:Metalloprotease n=1 Tax=Phytophthora megakarya TaxID=4795 RepID=A0A225VFJ6_9STRA|nr:Metalloprotease [Phytophthora megakarya]
MFPGHTDSWFAAGAVTGHWRLILRLRTSCIPMRALAVAQYTNLKITCRGIYGVGKAATHKAALVCLNHVPGGADEKDVAMVGKGIIVETGGLSIKAGGFMERDMGRSASLLIAFVAACHTKNTTDRHRSCGAVCIETSVGQPASTRVEDVLMMYSGT